MQTLPEVTTRSNPSTLKNRPMLSSRSNSNNSTIGQQLINNRASQVQPEKSLVQAAKTKIAQRNAPRTTHSFMRPTTASVNKGSIPNLPKIMKATTLVK